MNRTKLGILFILLLAIVMPAHATLRYQADEHVVIISAGDPIQIGLVTSLSGDTLPEAGTDVRNAALLAIDQFNENGGLNDFLVELVIEDDQCRPDLATEIAEVFVEPEFMPNLVAMIGHLCSGATKAALPYYEEAGIPMISASATNASLTQSGSMIFNRVIFSDSAQGTVVARYIREVLDAESIVVLHDGDDYGRGLAEIVADVFANELGGDVMLTTAIETSEGMEFVDYSDILSEIQELAPDVIYYGGYHEEAAFFVEQMQEMGMDDITFFSGDGVKIEAFLEAAGEFAESVYASAATSVGEDAEANAEFDQLYEDTYGVLPDGLGPYHAQAFDAANMILNALTTVAEVDDDGNLVVDRTALAEAIRNTAEYEGLSGPITCDETGDCGASLIQVFRVEDGVFVEQEVPSELQATQTN